MKLRPHALLAPLALVLLPACNSDNGENAAGPEAPGAGSATATGDSSQGTEAPETPDVDAPAADAPQDDVAALRAHVAELAAREEHTDPTTKVQHILIAFKGVPQVPATRSKDEAEALTARILREVNEGADFDALVKEHTDDSHPGIYSMRLQGSGFGTRSGMVPAFGNVAWRLSAGEVGVAPHDQRDSPYGWHIVKRLE